MIQDGTNHIFQFNNKAICLTRRVCLWNRVSELRIVSESLTHMVPISMKSPPGGNYKATHSVCPSWRSVYSLSKAGSEMCLLPFGLDWEAAWVITGNKTIHCRNIKGSILAMLLQFTSNFSQASKGHSVDSWCKRVFPLQLRPADALRTLSLSTCADKSKENVNNGKEWQAVLLLALVIWNTSETHTSASPWQSVLVPLKFFTLVRMTHILETISSKSGAPRTFRHWLRCPLGVFSILSAVVINKGCCALLLLTASSPFHRTPAPWTFHCVGITFISLRCPT